MIAHQVESDATNEKKSNRFFTLCSHCSDAENSLYAHGGGRIFYI